jgi:hypothetical protein
LRQLIVSRTISNQNHFKSTVGFHAATSHGKALHD